MVLFRINFSHVSTSVDAFPRFVVDTYSISESASQTVVCIMLDIELEKEVVVEMRTEDDTATS